MSKRLYQALYAFDLDAARRILRASPKQANAPDPDYDPELPIHLAVGPGVGVGSELPWLEVVRMLVERGADVNARGRNGYTPLHYAAEQDNVEVADYLISHGADMEAADDQGFTPLMEVSHGASPGMLGLLLTRGARIDLCTAVNLGRADWVRWLLRDGPALMPPYPYGDGLHGMALSHCRPDIARLLEEHLPVSLPPPSGLGREETGVTGRSPTGRGQTAAASQLRGEGTFASPQESP